MWIARPMHTCMGPATFVGRAWDSCQGCVLSPTQGDQLNGLHNILTFGSIPTLGEEHFQIFQKNVWMKIWQHVKWLAEVLRFIIQNQSSCYHFLFLHCFFFSCPAISHLLSFWMAWHATWAQKKKKIPSQVLTLLQRLCACSFLP